VTPTRIRTYVCREVTYDLGLFPDGWHWRAPGGAWSERSYASGGAASNSISATARRHDGEPCAYCTRPTHGRDEDGDPACVPGVECGRGLPVTPPATNAGAGT
jgi:hypothetical protein